MADPPRNPPELPGSGRADAPQDAADPRPGIGLPEQLAGSGALDRLVETARGYAAQAAAAATRRAYAADWARFARWARRRGAALSPPDPQLVGLYVADCAAGAGATPALSVASIERTLSGLASGYRARGFSLDQSDRHIAQVLAGVRVIFAVRPPPCGRSRGCRTAVRPLGTIDYLASNVCFHLILLKNSTVEASPKR